ncbi:MAG: hypothetical protein ACE37F_29670 [Nannocystaceae bacterium]|nr:hypothetical protein [bacterium]
MRWTTLILCLVAGCATAPNLHVDERGTPIYDGAVYGSDGDQLFEYTRTSRAEGDALVSTHHSREVDGGRRVTLQSATHSEAYALQRSVEHHDQLGIRSEVVVDGDRIRMTTVRNGRVRTKRRRLSGPAVVGPTLFGFVLHHWDALSRGESVALRFVVPQRRSTYAFDLKMTERDSATTTVVMQARSTLVRASVPAMRMVFDSTSHEILRYEGRIPPQLNGKPVDARVEYTMRAPFR